MLSFILLTLCERILGTKSGFGCYRYYGKKKEKERNNKVNQAEKVALLTFTFELM